MKDENWVRVMLNQSSVFERNFHFSQLPPLPRNQLAEEHGVIAPNILKGPRDDKHLPQPAKPHRGASPPPPRSHTTLQV